VLNFKEEILKIDGIAAISKLAGSSNTETYLVGGFVRDLVLGRPCKDIDIVCLGSGEFFAEKCAENLQIPKESLVVFKNFGTAMFHYNGYEYEFVGARKESYRSHSRKPIVENGSIADDQNRRDFTINAMGISLNEDNFGDVIDPFGGLADLQKKIIRTPLDPSITFADDPLRMMRAIRFASQLNFDIDANTYRAIASEKGRIEIVSKERIIDELNKIVLSAKPSYGFKLLDVCGLLELIFPEFCKLKGVETEDGRGHKDNFYHTLQVLDNVAVKSDNLWLRWAAILHDIAKPATKRYDKKKGWTFHGHEDLGAKMTRPIFDKLRLPLNEKLRFVQKLVRLHLRPIALSKETITDSAIRRLLFEAGDDIDALMTLCRADITSKNNEKVKRFLKNFDEVEQKLKEVEAKDQLRNFQPVITGEIIMDTFGLQPSKEVGLLKIALREAILEGELINEYQQGMEFLLVLGQKMGLKPAHALQSPKDS
jgi:poly(A) polymerase